MYKFLCCCLLSCSFFSLAQKLTLEATTMAGTIMQHNPDISHLITEHPTASSIALNIATDGSKTWHEKYNFPDYGGTFVYQDLKNFFLGESYTFLAHVNFYAFERRFQYRVAQGFTVATKPYDRETNPRNNAYGTRIMSATALQFNYVQPQIFDRFGAQAGVHILHHSNANVRAPNNSTNSLLFQIGLNYALDKEIIDRTKQKDTTQAAYKFKFNTVVRAGVNESDFVNSGQFPFYEISAYVDRQITSKSILVAGVDFMKADFLEEFEAFLANSYPELGVSPTGDTTRVGIMAGHELHLGIVALITQAGYYVYWPIEFESRIYNRLGLRFTINKHLFTGITVKSHGAKAEGASINLGYRW